MHRCHFLVANVNEPLYIQNFKFVNFHKSQDLNRIHDFSVLRTPWVMVMHMTDHNMSMQSLIPLQTLGKYIASIKVTHGVEVLDTWM